MCSLIAVRLQWLGHSVTHLAELSSRRDTSRVRCGISATDLGYAEVHQCCPPGVPAGADYHTPHIAVCARRTLRF